MSDFVLVHGFWHDGAAWQATVRQLQKNGHRAFAPTMASHEKGVNKAVMPGSHDTLYTNPSLLAEKLAEAGRD